MNMDTLIKKEFILEGLDCAHCSAKIEHDVNGIHGLEAWINFMTRTLIVDSVNEYGDKELLEEIEKIVHKYEPEVKDVEKHNQELNKNTKDKLLEKILKSMKNITNR